jgi:branched-chain amino acid aminotransferase
MPHSNAAATDFKMYIFINNKFYRKEDAKISVYDHGFLYGDGIFETMCSYDGTGIFLLKKHLERLRRSAELISLHIPWNDRYLTDRIYKTLRLNKLKNAYVRLTVSRGAGPVGLNINLCKKPTLVIMTERLKLYPKEFYTKGVDIAISSLRRNHPKCLNPGVKSSNFLNNILARISSSGLGGKNFFESIMCNLDGYVTEGTITNIFIVKNKVLKTPSIKCGILPGITREVVLKLARKNSIKISEGYLRCNELFDADECFLTNTSIKIMPVKMVGIHRIKTCPGEVTELLQAKYKQMVKCSTRN